MFCAVLGILVSEPDCLFIIPGLCCAHGWGGSSGVVCLLGFKASRFAKTPYLQTYTDRHRSQSHFQGPQPGF